jgi:hypothetical protein
MQHPSTRRPRAVALSATLALALLAGVTTACSSPAPPGGPSPTAQFCEFWDKVEEAPPAPDNAVLVKDEVVALAEDTTVTGSSCTDPGAEVALDGAVLAEGEEVPLEQGTSNPETIAAVTGEEIGAGEPVLTNLTVQALSVEIGLNGITLRGNVNVTLSGVTSTIGFVGTLQDLDNWSISLSSSSFTIPGITVSPVVFAGTLRSTNGVPSLSLTANASSIKVGDISVTGASLNLTASPTTGVDASVTGTIKVGPSTASGTVAVVFDNAGAIVSAKADISARLRGTQAGGQPVDLTGTVKLDGNAQETVVTFSASGVVGDLVINEANGTLTLATNRATFIGVLDVASGPNFLRYNGTIVWDGITATPTLTLQAGGEFSGTLADGQTVSASGTLETEVFGGQIRTVLTGSFKVGTLKATGSAVVEINGATTVLYVDAALTDAGFTAALDGAVVITDGLAETVSLNAAVTGSVNLGDATLTGADLSITSSYGSPLDLSFSGGLAVGSEVALVGSLDASFGPNGTLLSLSGQASGSLDLDSWVLDFNGNVVATPDQVTLTGNGSLAMVTFPLGITFNGSLSSKLTEPTWSLNGSGRLRIASIDVASARLSLSQTAGMKSTRTGFYFSILGIPTYFEGDFFLLPTGGCSKVNITGGSFLAKPLLALILPGVIGCPVYI